MVETGSAETVSDALAVAPLVGVTGLGDAGAETVALADTVAGLSDGSGEGAGGSFGAGTGVGAGGSLGAVVTGSDCAGAASAFEPAAGETDVGAACVEGWVVLASPREVDLVGTGVVAGSSGARERVATETVDAGVPVPPTCGACG